MFTLPRGVDLSEDRPLATSAWESPEAVERLAYRNGGEIFLGAIPASEHWPLLGKIYEQGHKGVMAIAGSGRRPAERADMMKTLERGWREAMLADCVPIALDDDQHMVTIAGSRTGKGTSAIIPNLICYGGSVVCIDPKGECANITSLQRGHGTSTGKGLGQTVHVFDPFGVTKVPEELRTTFNPVALLDCASSTVVTDAGVLAEGLVVPVDERSAHWDVSARVFVKGLLLHLATAVEKPNLFDMRRYLTQGDTEGWEKACFACEDGEGDQPDDALKRFLAQNPSPFTYLLNAMRDNPAFNGIVAGAARTLQDCGHEERGSILSTARRNTEFLDEIAPQFIETLQGNGRTFQPDDFKKDPKGVTLFLCIPANRIESHGRLLRIIISLLLEYSYRDLSPPASGAPFLFLMDEFPTLGHMSVIEKAAGYAAGYGVKLWMIIQNLQQISAVYKSYQTLLANAGVIQVFGISDPDTTAYVSKMLGEVQVTRNVKNRTFTAQHGSSDPSAQQRASGLLGMRSNMVGGMITGVLSATASNEGQTMAESINPQYQVAPLLRPDEITREFARDTGAQLLLIKGRLPIWCLRVDYFAHPWFAGLYVPDRPGDLDPARRKSFHEPTPEVLDAIARRFNVSPS